MKTLLALPLLISIALFSHYSNSQTIYSSVKKFQEQEFVQNGSIGIQIVDVNTKEVISAVNSNKIMPTASTTKLFSTAYALEQLGPEYRSKTILGSNGTIEKNILKGDLIIQSFGDVSLGSKYFNEHKDSFLNVWLNVLIAKGIQVIEGKIIVDGSYFGYEGSPADWQWGDIGNAYGAHFSGTNLYDNILLYTFKTGKAGTISELLYTTPPIPLSFDNRIFAGKVNGDNSSLFGAVYSIDRYGTGELPELKSNYTVRGSMPDPEQALAYVIENHLEQNNIRVNTAKTSRLISNSTEIKDTFLIYQGKRLEDILRVTNFESVNLFAEGVMRIAAAETKGFTRHVDACSAMENYWKDKLTVQHLILNDGSGLSRTNCISASMLVDLLIYMQKSKYSTIFYNTLPQAGLQGTLKNVAKNKPAQGVMRAKSGTMRRVKSYAGYVDSKSGKRLAFAIIVNQHTCSNKELVTAMEDIFNAMANY